MKNFSNTAKKNESIIDKMFKNLKKDNLRWIDQDFTDSGRYSSQGFMTFFNIDNNLILQVPSKKSPSENFERVNNEFCVSLNFLL